MSLPLITWCTVTSLVLATGVLCVALAGGPVAGSTSVTAPGDAISVAFAGPSVQLVGEQNLATGCTRLYITRDLVHFIDVSPRVWRLPARYGGLCAWVGYQAAFVTPQDGWVLARNGGSVTTVLAHTVDGGRTWTREQGGTTGSNGGSETIGFSSASDGWRQQIAQGSSAPFVLQHTVDAGASWADVVQHGGCAFDTDVFPSNTVGYETSDGTTAFSTSDGGTTWRRFALPRPSNIAGRDPALYGAPVFSGSTGVMPVTYLAPTREDVTFFLTLDGGASWHPAGIAVVRGGAQLRAPSSCPGGPQQARGRIVLTSAGSPSSWWILKEGPAGRALVFTAVLRSGGGIAVVGHVARGLPSTVPTGFQELFGATATRALFETDGGGNLHTWVTVDGGASWRRLPAGSP